MKPQTVILVLQTFLLTMCHFTETQKLWKFVINIKTQSLNICGHQVFLIMQHCW